MIFWKLLVLLNVLKNFLISILIESSLDSWILSLESWSWLFLNLESLLNSWFFGIIKITLEDIASTRPAKKYPKIWSFTLGLAWATKRSNSWTYSSTPPVYLRETSLSYTILLVFPPNLLIKEYENSFQDGFLDFRRQYWNQCIAFPSILRNASLNLSEGLTCCTSKNFSALASHPNGSWPSKVGNSTFLT